jgi:hypothetical protein
MTDIHPNIGTLGQTRSTWRDDNHLRGLLLRLVIENPQANREELEALYLDKAESNSTLVEEALRRSFDNDYWQLQRPAKRRRPLIEAEVTAVTEQLRVVVLLDLVLPNGKKLRECSGQECRQAGGWLTAVADRIGNRGIVGEKLSEAEVAALYANPKSKRKKDKD